jgi:putative ABC transport system substrate-binding protein
MKLKQTISILILLYLVAIVIIPCFALNRPFIAVIKSWDLDSYNNALKGFNEVLEKKGIKPWLLDDYNMQGSEEKGREITRQIASKKPDLVLTLGTRATRIAVQDIKDVPVVFSMVLEPVASGLIESMACSGNNLTGASLDIPIKVQFETLKVVVPGLKKIGVLYMKGN